MVITQDEDWYSLIGSEDGTVLPDFEELFERLMVTHDIREENGKHLVFYLSFTKLLPVFMSRSSYNVPLKACIKLQYFANLERLAHTLKVNGSNLEEYLYDPLNDDRFPRLREMIFLLQSCYSNVDNLTGDKEETTSGGSFGRFSSSSEEHLDDLKSLIRLLLVQEFPVEGPPLLRLIYSLRVRTSADHTVTEDEKVYLFNLLAAALQQSALQSHQTGHLHEAIRSSTGRHVTVYRIIWYSERIQCAV
ncbi:hypothetical protein BDZ97DRAFT_1757515 [Flammula alnicola]|nr:hypothetical protein BDZ97DRAFT_1757515 [Flammula alnicola]